MANYTTLKNSISQVIGPNGNNDITGTVLQNVLTAMVNSLGAKYQFVGVATPSTNPGTPDYNVAYLAGPGTYINFNGMVIPDGSVGILKYSGSWTVETIALPSGTTVSWNQIVATGTKIATITINGNTIDVYAPSGGGGSAVNYVQTFVGSAASPAKVIGVITINGTPINVQVPANFFKIDSGVLVLDTNVFDGPIVGKAEATVYVGPSDAFTTLGAALAYLSKLSHYFKNGGLSAKAILRRNFSCNEDIEIVGVDLSFIEICLDGFTPPPLTDANKQAFLNGELPGYGSIDCANTSALFTIRRGGKSPFIRCLFVSTVSGTQFARLYDDATMQIDHFCGCKDFDRAIYAVRGSRVFACGAVFEATTIGAIFASHCSIVEASESFLGQLNSDDEITVTAKECSTVNIDSAYIPTTPNSGTVTAESSSHINALNMRLYGNGFDVYGSAFGSSIVCFTITGNYTGDATVLTRDGGIMYVKFSQNITVSSPAMNTISANGIIFG